MTGVLVFFRTDSIIILRGGEEIENKELTAVTHREGMVGVSEETRTFTSSPEEPLVQVT